MKAFLTLFLLTSSIIGYSQVTVGKDQLKFRKEFVPYELHYIYGLNDLESVILSQGKRGFQLEGLDKYMFVKWSYPIKQNKKYPVPQFLLKGDTAIVSFFVKDKRANELRFEYAMVNAYNGSVIKEGASILGEYDEGAEVMFSGDFSKYVVHNILQKGKSNYFVKVYEPGNDTTLQTLTADTSDWTGTSTCVYVSNTGSITMVKADEMAYKYSIYHQGIEGLPPIEIEGSFYFERPVEKIDKMYIRETAEGNYMLVASAKIGDELIGINTCAIDMENGNILFNKTQNFAQEVINSWYEKSFVNNEKQSKRALRPDDRLEGFSLIGTKLWNGQLIAYMEKADVASRYQDNYVSRDLSAKWKRKEEKHFFNEDLIVMSLNMQGEINWVLPYQKEQDAYGDVLTSSFVPYYTESSIKLLTAEPTRKASQYVTVINQNGDVVQAYALLPKEYYSINKNYTTWLNEHTLLICAFDQAKEEKRYIMMVEFGDQLGAK